MRQRQVRREAGDPFNLCAAVRFGVESFFGGTVGGVRLDPIAEVDPTGEFADDRKVGAGADFFLERGDFSEGGGGEGARAKVAEGGEFFAQLQDALFGADGRGGRPFGTADSAEEDGMGGASGGEGGRGQRVGVCVDGRLGRSRIRVDPRIGRVREYA